MQGQDRDGFSLVELMVVIAIIVMLTALLLPALNRAIGRARQTQCMNNVRQLGIGLQQFVSEYHHYPLSVDTESDRSGHPTNFNTWTEAIEYQLAGDDHRSNPSFWARVSGFVRALSRKVFWGRVSTLTVTMAMALE